MPKKIIVKFNIPLFLYQKQLTEMMSIKDIKRLTSSQKLEIANTYLSSTLIYLDKKEIRLDVRYFFELPNLSIFELLGYVNNKIIGAYECQNCIL